MVSSLAFSLFPFPEMTRGTNKSPTQFFGTEITVCIQAQLSTCLVFKGLQLCFFLIIIDKIMMESSRFVHTEEVHGFPSSDCDDVGSGDIPSGFSPNFWSGASWRFTLRISVPLALPRQI